MKPIPSREDREYGYIKKLRDQHRLEGGKYAYKTFFKLVEKCTYEEEAIHKKKKRFKLEDKVVSDT